MSYEMRGKRLHSATASKKKSRVGCDVSIISYMRITLFFFIKTRFFSLLYETMHKIAFNTLKQSQEP